MKEYTILALLSVALALFIDRRLGVNLFRRKMYYLLLAIIFGFKLLVNGYLTGQNIVLYNRRFFLGFRLGTIPAEDFLFGFSMLTMSIIFWEYFKGKEN